MQHSEFDWKTSDGLKLYAQDWRPETESKGLVCLVHGLGEHSGRYVHLAALLNQAGYALVAFDLRGHGEQLPVRRPYHFAYRARADAADQCGRRTRRVGLN